jgi:NAD-dependent dihydropyrimidine dehydrogenase PreA subunit
MSVFFPAVCFATFGALSATINSLLVKDASSATIKICFAIFLLATAVYELFYVPQKIFWTRNKISFTTSIFSCKWVKTKRKCRAMVDKEKCIGCGACESVCPVGCNQNLKRQSANRQKYLHQMWHMRGHMSVGAIKIEK